MNPINAHIKELLISVMKETENYVLAKDINWDGLSLALLSYEVDSKALITELDKLQLINVGKLIEKIPDIYDDLMDQLAEDYVLGINKDSITKLLGKKDSLLNNKINFHKTLKDVITKQERKRLKKELPIMYERNTFEVTEAELENAIRKKARNELKEKFNNWNKELLEEPAKQKKEPKIITLSWLKYAAVAVLLVSVGLFYYNTDQFSKTKPAFTVVEKTTFKTEVLTNEALGSNDIEEFTITVNTSTKNSIEYSKNKDDSINNISKIKKPSYLFLNNNLTLYNINTINKPRIIKTLSQDYFLYIENDFYPINANAISEKLVIEKDKEILNELNEIIYENE